MVRKGPRTLPKFSLENSPLGEIRLFVSEVAFTHR